MSRAALVVGNLALACCLPHPIRQTWLLDGVDGEALATAARRLELDTDAGTAPGQFFITRAPEQLGALEVQVIDGGFEVTGLTVQRAPYDDDALGRVPRVLAAAGLAELGPTAGTPVSPRSLAFTATMDVLLPTLGAFYARYDNPYASTFWSELLRRLVPDVAGAADILVVALARPGGTPTVLDTLLVGVGIGLLVANRLLALGTDLPGVMQLNALSEAGYPIPERLPAPHGACAVAPDGGTCLPEP